MAGPTIALDAPDPIAYPSSTIVDVGEDILGSLRGLWAPGTTEPWGCGHALASTLECGQDPVDVITALDADCLDYYETPPFEITGQEKYPASESVDIADRVASTLGVDLVWQLGREFWTGQLTDTGLVQRAEFVGGANALSPAAAIDLLVSHWEDSHVGAGVIHVPSSAVTQMIALGGLPNTPSRSRQIQTYHEWPVSIGPGYVAADGPNGTGDPAIQAPANTAWLYVTGPVEYALSAGQDILDSDTPGSGLDVAGNEVRALRKYQAMVRSSGCAVYATLVDLQRDPAATPIAVPAIP